MPHLYSGKLLVTYWILMQSVMWNVHRVKLNLAWLSEERQLVTCSASPSTSQPLPQVLRYEHSSLIIYRNRFTGRLCPKYEHYFSFSSKPIMFPLSSWNATAWPAIAYTPQAWTIAGLEGGKKKVNFVCHVDNLLIGQELSFLTPYHAHCLDNSPV